VEHDQKRQEVPKDAVCSFIYQKLNLFHPHLEFSTQKMNGKFLETILNGKNFIKIKKEAANRKICSCLNFFIYQITLEEEFTVFDHVNDFHYLHNILAKRCYSRIVNHLLFTILHLYDS